MKSKERNTLEIIKILEKNLARNINMINFISNYGINYSYIQDNAVLISGISDKQWIYIDAETKKDFNILSDYLIRFENFAVFNDLQLKWLSEIMDIEIIMSCKKYIMPEEMYIEDTSSFVSVIDESYLQYIFNHYEYQEFVDINYIKNQMKNNLVLGIFVDKLLVAWIMTHDDGAMGFLTVLPSYRNKGYATLLSNAYIKHLRDKGKIPFIHIEEHNTKSLNLAKKSGFKYYGKVYWIKKKISIEEDINNKIKNEFTKYEKIGAKELSKIAISIYKKMPQDDDSFLKVCDYLISKKDMKFFTLMTLFMKKRKSLLTKKHIKTFDYWVNHYLFGWWSVDQLCYRVLSPVIESDPSLYSYLLKWSDSKNYLVRRACLVSMIKPKRKLIIHYDYDKMIILVDKLKNDKEYYVKKGVGWVLKCSYLSYPIKTEKYLRDNVMNLDRGIFRYALEHIENPLRKELLELKYK